MNPMDYHVWGAMLEAYCKLKTKPKTIVKLKQALQVIWAAGLCWSWRLTLRSFTVTMEFWHLIIS